MWHGSPPPITLTDLKEICADWRWWKKLYGEFGEPCEIVELYKRQLARFNGGFGYYLGFKIIHSDELIGE